MNITGITIRPRALWAAAVVLFALLTLATCTGGGSSVPRGPRDTGCDEPTLYDQHPGDNTDDAAGRGQLFERIEVPGITDRALPNGSSAWLDVNRDGLLDLVTHSIGEELHLAVNRGCFQFESKPITIERVASEPQAPTPGSPALAVADFNDDGLPDLIVGTDGVGVFGSGNRDRMQLLIARSYDEERGFILEDFAIRMGVDNPGAYARSQMSIGDVDRDGWLDFAVGAEQIGQLTAVGRPLSRMYIYQPAESGVFIDGRFEDIGGTELLEDFGGVDPDNCNPAVDKAVSSVLLRDLDDDGDLDLIQGSQADIHPLYQGNGPEDPCSPGRWRVGVFVFENLVADEGTLRFRKVMPGSGVGRDDDDMVLPEEGSQVYDAEQRRYVSAQRSVSAYILQTSDVDNDGDLDVLMVTPTDPFFVAEMEGLSGKFWRNDGNWRFPSTTAEQGLECLQWNYGSWLELFDDEFSPTIHLEVACGISMQPGACEELALEDYNMWAGDLLAADWDNDGWEDLVLVDRRELQDNWGTVRNAYIRNRGDGIFEPMPTTWSGLSENMIAGEAVDIDGDGLLDLYVMARNRGSGQTPPFNEGEPDDQENDRVYWNAGEKGTTDRYWVRVRLAGLPERKLLGANLVARDGDSGAILGRKEYTTVSGYKGTHDAFAHFGLGSTKNVDLEITLPDGGRVCAKAIEVGNVIELDVTSLDACDYIRNDPQDFVASDAKGPCRPEQCWRQRGRK